MAFEIPVEILDSLTARTLFYPCSGNDIHTPIEAFDSVITDFWFVDFDYTEEPLLKDGSTYRLSERAWEDVGTLRTPRGSASIRKVFHETYLRHLGSGTIRIHRCNGHALDAFEQLIRARGIQLSVFFHRGDSPGEGGSGIYWLDRHLGSVLETLEEGGLIVSDGSNAKRKFRRRMNQPDINPAEVKPFNYLNWRLECVGKLDNRRGPTLVWRVSKSISSSGS